MNIKKGFKKVVDSKFILGMVVCSLLYGVMNVIYKYSIMGYFVITAIILVVVFEAFLFIGNRLC